MASVSGQVQWNGFSDEDLQKIRRESQMEDSMKDDQRLGESKRVASLVAHKASSKRKKVHLPPRRAVVNGAGEVIVQPTETVQSTEAGTTSAVNDKEILVQQNVVAESLPTNDIMHSNTKDDNPLLTDASQKEEENNESDTSVSKNIEMASSCSNNLNEMNCTTICNNDLQKNLNNNDQNIIASDKKVSLDEMQQRQKMLEEQNNKKRALLAKTIAERKKKTQAEADKLCLVQTELKKLDSLVSNDVSILRSQIEVASMEFNDAQKRYDKAEKEFVEAKSILFSKMERKERLIEYLCTIIEENELRKANKLAQLMKELDLDTYVDGSREIEPTN